MDARHGGLVQWLTLLVSDSGSTNSQKGAFRFLWALTLASIAILMVCERARALMDDPLALIVSSPAERASNVNQIHAYPNATTPAVYLPFSIVN